TLDEINNNLNHERETKQNGESINVHTDHLLNSEKAPRFSTDLHLGTFSLNIFYTPRAEATFSPTWILLLNQVAHLDRGSDCRAESNDYSVTVDLKDIVHSLVDEACKALAIVGLCTFFDSYLVSNFDCSALFRSTRHWST